MLYTLFGAGMGVHYDVSCAYAHEVEQRTHWTFTGEWSLGNAGPWDWTNQDYTNFLRFHSPREGFVA